MAIEYTKISKVALVGLEVKVDLVAQYNPKEISIEETTGWNAKDDDKDKHRFTVEFTHSSPRTLSMELLFDTYEEGTDVTKTYVDKLRQLTSVIDPDGAERYKQPPIVLVQWYDDAYIPFRGVIQSVSTKYTMFMPSGMPVRATCNIKIMEADSPFSGAKREPKGLKTRW
jgi:hypothetical protein